MDKIEKKRLAILMVLRDHDQPLGSHQIAEILGEQGDDISERTVRFHMHALDESGFTKLIGRQGRIITEPGLKELGNARIIERIGFLTARIDQMTYRMDFDLKKQSGRVVVNVSFLPVEQIGRSIPLIQKVYEHGYAMGRLMNLLPPGEHIGIYTVPDGHVGILTVCSITINGVLLDHGIPATSKFGGLLQLTDGKPVRFTDIIRYDGTTIDPLEIFIKSGMTDYSGATFTGNGMIGASFREIPASARDQAMEIASSLDTIGLSSIMKIGWSGHSLYEIPVNDGCAGMVVIGGLNPVAILEENGIAVTSYALSSLYPYEQLVSYKELESVYKSLDL